MLWRDNLHQPNCVYGILLVTVQVQYSVWIRLDDHMSKSLVNKLCTYVQKLCNDQIQKWHATPQAAWQMKNKSNNLNNLAKIRYRFLPPTSDTTACKIMIHKSIKHIKQHVNRQFCSSTKTEPKNWQLTHNSRSRVSFQCRLFHNHLSLQSFST